VKRILCWILVAAIWLTISLFLCLNNSCN